MTGEPTLHYGDQDADGWVEYLQQLLLGTDPHIKLDGIFLDQTIQDVYQFQQDNNLMVDGVVGNQTWSVLRGGEQQEVGTDGHQHQASDARMHAVFFVDQTPQGQTGEFNDVDGSLLFFLECVGSVPIPDNSFFLDININGGAQGHVFIETPLASLAESGQSNAGDMLSAKVERLKDQIGSGDFTYKAEIPPGIGGELHEGSFTIA